MFGLSIYAQIADDVYAITNANIVTVSGNPISGGTIVVRDGLIESVGTNVKIPADAKVFDAKGLTVYPGFIDTYTDLGIQKRTRRKSINKADRDKTNNPIQIQIIPKVYSLKKWLLTN